MYVNYEAVLPYDENTDMENTHANKLLNTTYDVAFMYHYHVPLPCTNQSTIASRCVVLPAAYLVTAFLVSTVKSK